MGETELVELITGKTGRKIIRLFIDYKRKQVAENEIFETLGKQGRKGWDVKAVLEDMRKAGLLEKTQVYSQASTVYNLNLDTLKRTGIYISQIGDEIFNFIGGL